MISKTMILSLFAIFALALAQNAAVKPVDPVKPVEPVDPTCFDSAGDACQVMGLSNSCGQWVKEATTVCRKTCGMCGSPVVEPAN